MDHVNPLGIETSGHHVIVWRHDLDQNLVETKSFRCTFCKRGFSNAQALGGHMNIHRKDRAKLMEFELLDDSSTIKRLEHGQNPNDDDMPRKNPERSLFAEVAPVSLEEVDMEEKRKVELINNGELDLELRLGPEPHHAKSKP